MKILFDQGTPAPLRHALVGHVVSTAYDKGWSSLDNGALRRAAEGDGFDVMITTDQSLRHEQNLSTMRMAIVVLPTTSWPRIQRHAKIVLDVVNAIKPSEIVDVVLPE
jgi:hypothetical protein